MALLPETLIVRVLHKDKNGLLEQKSIRNLSKQFQGSEWKQKELNMLIFKFAHINNWFLDCSLNHLLSFYVKPYYELFSI